MPSIFTRSRRNSESVPPTTPTEVSLASKRRSLDVGRSSNTPPVSGSKFKHLFASSNNGEGDGTEQIERKRESLKKRLSSVSQIFGESNAATTRGDGGVGSDGTSTNPSLKQRLSSASQFFSKHSPEESKQPPLDPTRSNDPSGANGTLGVNGASGAQAKEDAIKRYGELSPRSPSQQMHNAPFPSPTLFPNGFKLAKTTSPEGTSANRRGSVNWQASYPTVLPDDSYADFAVDQSPAQSRSRSSWATSPASPILPSENEFRRLSIQQPTSNKQNGYLATPVDTPSPGPEEVSSWPALKPTSPPPGPKPLPSPPQSAASDCRSTESVLPSSQTKVKRPTLSVVINTSSTRQVNDGSTEHEQRTKQLEQPGTSASGATAPVNDPALDKEQMQESGASKSNDQVNGQTETDQTPHDLAHTTVAPQIDAAPPKPDTTSTTFTSPTSISLPSRSSPRASAESTPAKRPGIPTRRTTLIQSPPMPQPIKNLPTLAGWPGFMKEGIPGTPGWNAAKENGVPKTPGWSGGGAPRTPGWGGLMSPGGSRPPGTPGGSGFPFTLPLTVIGQNKPKDKSGMSEEELRRERRAMPVMLRETPFQPEPQDAGEVEASDESDGESETESKGHPEDDSDPETETERSPQTGSAAGVPPTSAKSLRPLMPFNSRYKGKGKGNATAVGVSPLATTALREEEDIPASPPSSSAPPPDRGQQSPTTLSDLKDNTKANTSTTPKKPVWSLPTPGAVQPHSFGGSWHEFSSVSPTATPAAAPPLSTTSSVQPTITWTQSSSNPSQVDGYFGTHPSSSSASVNIAMGTDPVLTRDAAQSNVSATPTGLGLGPVADGKAQSRATTEPVENQQASAVADRSPPIHEVSEDHDEDHEDVNVNVDEGSEGASSQDHIGVLSGQAGAQVEDNVSSPTVDSIPHRNPHRPSLYSRPSRSMVNLSTSQSKPTSGPRPQLEAIRSRGSRGSRENAPTKIELPPAPIVKPQGVLSPGSEWAKPPPTPAASLGMFSWSKGKEGEEGAEVGQLKRRRSADDSVLPPPKYELPQAGSVIPRPRDEEGKEGLPKYWCAVHIEGTLSRKMEFSAPRIQSRDRSWKKSYFIVRGTSLLVYKFDPHRHPLKVQLPRPVPAISESESEEFLHVHVPGDRRASISTSTPATTTNTSGRRGSTDDPPSARRATVITPFVGQTATGASTDPRRSSVSSVATGGSTTASSTNSKGEKDPTLFPKSGPRRMSTCTTSSAVSTSTSIASHFQTNQLIKQYTLQNSESGLAADYVKRKNVVRVRAEGEQFLLQTDSARDVVDWIEAFQAATNVALDLDDRPMPKIITLPRRRRRRVIGAAGAAASAAVTAASGDANPPPDDTPAGNAAAVAAAENAERERERDRMQADMAEDQAATDRTAA